MTSLTTSKSSLVIGKLVEPSAKSKSWKQSSGSGCVSSSNAHKLKTRHKTDNNQVVILLVEHCIAFYQFWKLQQSSALKWLLFWRCRNFCQTIKVLLEDLIILIVSPSGLNFKQEMSRFFRDFSIFFY